jgi:phosphoribosylanthranilate isomerase
MNNDLLIKICGITNLDDALCACDNGVSAIGFIRYPKSKRFIDNKKIYNINNKLTDLYPTVKRVGVFVNSDHFDMVETFYSGVNIAQFHGYESDDYINKISLLIKDKLYNEKITKWKVIKPKSEDDIKKYINCNVDMFLIDTFDEKLYGGTGQTINFDLAKKIIKVISKPTILAGGITPDNIIEAIINTSPYGIDLSSGVEENPGCKDHKLILRLFKTLKEAGYNIL